MTTSQGSATPVQRFGLTTVSDPPGALVDLVLLHGLNGNPEKTWTAVQSRVFWPSQLLPQFVEEQKVRVMVYGYDADVSSLGGPGVTKDKIHNHAERLVAELSSNRKLRKATERPIVFVAHSLGGLVVKRALIHSSEIAGTKTAHLRSIFISTYGILFLGTPHRGADLAQWGSYLESLAHAILPKKALDTGSQLVDALKTNSETLLNIDRQFAQILDNFHIFFFHEAKPTDMKGTLRFIVEEESAAPTLPDVERAGIQADHQHMCKFESESAPGFDLVMEGIQRYAEEAPKTIRTRWNSENFMSKERVNRKVQEQFGVNIRGTNTYDELLRAQLNEQDSLNRAEGSQSSSVVTPGSSTIDLNNPLRKTKHVHGSTDAIDYPPSQPESFFIVPPGFRANTHFVGMEKELRTLDERLFDTRRNDGTAAVVLHGQPGVGKTHVARQYIYENRQRFSGGIFWINAFLRDEMRKDFWQIQQRVVAKVAPELIPSYSSAGDGFVEVVKNWFQSRQDWLIVFDAVAVESETDIQYLSRFVPDSQNSSLIFISRSRRLETMQRLLHPWPIKVSALREQEGRKLLLREAGIKKPRESEIKSANALSNKVGGLPLAITAIARRLADTHEPIAKFNIKSYSTDPKIGGTYRLIMDDLQQDQQSEALNLINVLCFFGPHTPVEMLNLGMKAFRAANVNVKSHEGESGNQDLNVTFSILMRHALIERNDPDDSESMSSSQSQSHDSLVEPEPIDIVNMHTVVQKFWRDTLDTNNALPPWLMLASQVFTQSFREANLRLKNSSKPARLSDYRWYLIHGQRLLDHSHKHEHRSQSLEHIRAELEPYLKQIHEEIRLHQPNSSQESISQTEFQISIFDRTSTSSSGHSDSGFRERPPPLPLPGHTEFGIPLSHRSSDSPISVHAPVYHPNYPFLDEGSELSSYPMFKEFSGSTVRPRTDSNASQDWEINQNKKGASFRRAQARTEINAQHASGSFAGLERPSGSGSYAISSLSDHHSRPSEVSRDRPSFWQRTWSHSPSKPAPTRNVAEVVAEQIASTDPGRTTSGPTHAAYPPPSVDPNLPHGRTPSPRSPRGAANSRRRRSPKAQSYKKTAMSRDSSINSTTDLSLQQELYLLSQASAGASFVSQAPPSVQPSVPPYHHPSISGRNPMPLPYETITVQPLTHLRGQHAGPPSETASHHSSRPATNPDLHPYQTSSHHPFSPAYPSEASVRPSFSAPMSRDHSGQSHHSDPLAQMQFLPPGVATTAGVPIEQPSPRARRSDGRPLSKSPKFNSSAPLPPRTFEPPAPGSHAASEAISRSGSAAILAGTGAWSAPPIANDPRGPAFQSPPSTVPGSSHPSPASAAAMSRAGSGPGFMVPTPTGLGIAAFGEPVDQRVSEWNRRTRLQERDPNSRWTPPPLRADTKGFEGHDARRASTVEAPVGMYGRQGINFEGVPSAGAYTYAPPPQIGGFPTEGQVPGNPQTTPWGYASGYGPGSLRPSIPIMASAEGYPPTAIPFGTTIEAPYPEANRIPTEAGSLAYSAMAEQQRLNVQRARGNSAPESPGWSGKNFWGN